MARGSLDLALHDCPIRGASILVFEMSWNADIDPTNRIIEPVGLPLAVISTSCVFLILGLVFTGIRLYIRVVDRVFGLDDWLMAAGCVSVIEIGIYVVL